MKIVTLGELMLRLSSPGHDRLAQAQSFEVTYGGSEANVAATLAQFGLHAALVTRLPLNAIGEAALAHCRRHGISTDFIQRGGDRLGIYFLEHGASQRPSLVVYDRAGSAFSAMTSADVDWEAVMHGTDWFHVSGITPALGAHAHKLARDACQAAQAVGATVSCDLNYRKKLWTVDEAQAVMKPLMRYVDVCIANEEDAWRCLGMRAEGTDIEAGHLDEGGYTHLAEQLKRAFGFTTVAITLRESFSASRNAWSAIMLDNKECRTPYRSRRYDIQIVDRVGAGDAFAGGLIAGLITKSDSREALEFAVAASCLAHSFRGDFNLATKSEVDKLAGGSGSGRVDR